MAERLRGTVRFWSRKGYGFLRAIRAENNNGNVDDAGDVFVHFTAFDGAADDGVPVGTAVEYEIGENHRGRLAVNVKILKEVKQDDNEDVLEQLYRQEMIECQ